MSARFGRNQRRSAREALASTQLQLKNERQAREMDGKLMGTLSVNNQVLRDEIRAAKTMLPHFTALLSAETLELNQPPAGRVYAHFMPPFGPTDDHQPMVREVPLDVMLAGLTEHQRYGSTALRAHVIFRGREAASIAVSEEAIHVMTRKQLAHEMARNLAEQLVEQLKGPRR